MSVIADFGHEKRPIRGSRRHRGHRDERVGRRTASTVAYLLRTLAARGLDVPLLEEFPGHGARDLGQHRSRTMKRSSRQCAFIGLIAVSGSSPASAVRL